MASSLLGDGEDLPILRQVFGAHSHETQAWRFVVRNRRDWARVQLRDVTVDFANEMLLVETLGRRLSDGYGVEILRVWRDGGLLRVESEVSSPGPNAPPTIATPFCIAVIPKCDLKVAGFDSRPPARMRPWEQSPPPTGEW